ncbi:hypothetical protein QLL95_gp1226 [Cotonvirus japonicus]|uniref:Uncharacterized protein n=1 Tax=Cotonvirus japonicus TaxID=2811091 RepID=A0ABM7NS27_9VIRU|nr:hypothetical protein QLL95_gp1226 [Cotonvirus japonicus]BCS82897.1 hypothetical protein [Cotonvirus japonicus]
MTWCTTAQVNNSGKHIPKGKTSGSFAPLDIAFNHSPSMSDFKNRLSNTNPIFSDDHHDQIIDNHLRNLPDCNENCDNVLSNHSEQKLNSGVDQIVGEYYDRNKAIHKQLSTDHAGNQYFNPQVPTVQNGIQFPLTRHQYIPSQVHGSELLEGFDGARRPCMGFWEMLVLIILIIVLIYGIYWLYKSNSFNF